MKVVLQDLLNQAHCPEHFRLHKKDGPDESDLGYRFRLFLSSVFQNDLMDKPKLTLNQFVDTWNRIFFYKRKRLASQLATSYLKTLPSIHEFHTWYISLPHLITAVNFNPRNFLHGVTLFDPIVASYSNEDFKTLNVIHMVSSTESTPFDFTRYDVAYPMAIFFDTFSSSQFNSLTVNILEVVKKNDSFKVKHHSFSPDQAYIEYAQKKYSSIIKSLTLDMPLNVLACSACPSKDICTARKGDEER